MATKTNKLGLTLPAGSETVNINVLNDNFSIIDEKVGSTIVYEGDFGTNEELLEKINAAYSMVDDNSVGHAKLRATVEGLEIGGGTWHFTFYRTNATYGWLECGTYYGNYKYYRRLYEGKWEEWVDISPRPPVPAIHASQHAADGNDPLTPEMIGITTIVATDENNDGNVVLEAYVGDSYAEHTGSQNNPHNVTIGQIGAAPSGYGLGTYGQLLTADHNLNNPLPTGMYRWGSSVPINAPSPIGYAVMLHIARTDGDSIQKVWHLGTHSGVQISAERYLSDNNGEWEWNNPPMTADVEYRTTERINGKAVYKKRDSNGVMWYRLDGESGWTEGVPGAAPAYSLNSGTLSSAGWYKVGTIKPVGGDFTTAGRITIGGNYNTINHSSAIIDVITDYDSMNAMVIVPTVKNAGVTQVGFIRTEMKTFDVYVGYANNTVNAIYISVDMTRGTFVKADFVPSSVAESGMAKIVAINKGSFDFSRYGLGGSTVHSTADEALKTGFYHVWLQNVNNYTGYVNLHVMNNGDDIITQTAYGAWGEVMHRVWYGGAWTEWAIENPPMSTNVAYLTTERFSGKPVYAKAVYVGTLPNNGTKTVDGVIESGIYNLVSLEGKFYNSGNTYTFTHNENIHLSLGVEQPYAWLNIKTTADFSSYAGFVVIKWTRP